MGCTLVSPHASGCVPFSPPTALARLGASAATSSNGNCSLTPTAANGSSSNGSSANSSSRSAQGGAGTGSKAQDAAHTPYTTDAQAEDALARLLDMQEQGILVRVGKLAQ